MKFRAHARNVAPRAVPRRRSAALGGFTLVEILIVIVILAIVSSVLVIQLQYNTRHTELTTLRYNESTLNELISVYATEHFGRTPEVVDGTLPQLLASTDANGTIGAGGAAFPYGPYVADGRMPTNFRTNSNVVAQISEYPPSVYQGGGWLYHRATGRIVADHKPGNAFEPLVEIPRIDGLTASSGS